MADVAADPSEPAGSAAQPRAVVLVGAGARARAWLAPLRRSARLRAVATVARGGESAAADLPRHASIDAALRAHPAAAFALALPPRAGLEGALLLAAAGRAAVVEAPLDDAIAAVEPGPGWEGVRVAHGWVTLPGLRAIAAALRRAGAGRARFEVAGLPEEDGCDPAEGLVHAAALVRTLFPRVTPSAARLADGGVLEAELAAPSEAGQWEISLRVLPRGRRLAVRVEGTAEPVVWSWEADRESVRVGARPIVTARATPAAPVRALAQLLPDAPRGDGLAEAAGAQRLVRGCLALLPSRLPPGRRLFAQSASIARRRPADLLGRLGLRGEIVAVGTAPEVLRLALPPEPFELWAFRAGVKPVAFLTVNPADAERTLAFFGDAHHERRERRVHVDAQDRWTDRRDHGEPRVELYIARDAELARRAARLQAEEDPTRALAEIGALVGYPPCCVAAFARQDDRANNSRNRYESRARTLAPDGSTPAPWPWELNNLHTMVAPFYPCSYRCAAALAWARAALAELARAHPAFAAELGAVLSRPVLYFDHDHQLVFDGAADGGEILYRSVAVLPSTAAQLAPLAAAISVGDRLSFDERELRVEGAGRTVLRLTRTDPALGFIAPFGAVGPS